jgi:beta-galactosidase
MKLGTAYYPERSGVEQWRKDFEKIRGAGMETIRIAEFAWSRLEPEEGRFCWDWLDESLEEASRYGLDVILCTPTACPPVWLVEKYPDVLPVNNEGRRMVFGKRQHRCYNSPAYLEYTRRIVTAMVQRYGKHPVVTAWQLDNEFGGERKSCYCSYCETAFQKYLQDKYNSIDELNQRWGNFFWSEDYQRFDQIRVPLQINAELWLKYNPSLELEFTRFSSRSIVEYSRMQTSILRQYTDKTVTTNTDGFYYGDNVNLHELFRDLDIGAIDIYSEKKYEIAFYADIMRSLKGGTFWMTEFGVESPTLDQELSLLEKRGCEFLSFFVLNPFPWGQEQGTKALLTLTGEPTANYHLVKKWKEDYSRRTQDTKRSWNPRVGIFYDFDSSWAYTQTRWSPGVDKWIYPIYMLETVYKSIFESGSQIRFLYKGQTCFNGLDVVAVPLHILYDVELEAELIHFVENGGKVIVTDDLFQKNTDNVYLTHVPGIYEKLLGWGENNFIYPAKERDGFVVREHALGQGKTWMIRTDTCFEEWKQLWSTIWL